MLKIKDNVDLKELGKYGFRELEVECWSKDNFNVYDNYYFRVLGDNCPQTTEFLKKNQFPRRLFVNTHNNNAYDALFELIKADLIEKV